MLKYQYEDLKMIFCDEVSMMGSSKLARINFRLQDMADGAKKRNSWVVFHLLRQVTFH